MLTYKKLRDQRGPLLLYVAGITLTTRANERTTQQKQAHPPAQRTFHFSSAETSRADGTSAFIGAR
ncbi:MAG: hypothetical protein VXA08_02925 [Alphaproteobacteria bacterium]